MAHLVLPSTPARPEERLPAPLGHVGDEQPTGPKRARERLERRFVLLDLK